MYRSFSLVFSVMKLCLFFPLQTGFVSPPWRQGGSLSPLIVSLFISDEQSHIETHGGKGTESTDSFDVLRWLKRCYHKQTTRLSCLITPVIFKTV